MSPYMFLVLSAIAIIIIVYAIKKYFYKESYDHLSKEKDLGLKIVHEEKEENDDSKQA